MVPTIEGGSVPISTRIITEAGEAAQQNVVPGITDPELATPETVNQAANRVDQGIQQTQQDREQQQTDRRSAALEVGQAQRQQELAEDFIAQSTGTESNNNDSSLSFTDAIELAQRNQRAQSLETVGRAVEERSELDRRVEESIQPAPAPAVSIQA